MEIEHEQGMGCTQPFLKLQFNLLQEKSRAEKLQQRKKRALLQQHFEQKG